MWLRQLKPFIPSGPDFGRTREFFQDLGFSLDWEVQGLAQISLGGATFILQDFHNKEMQDNLMMLVSVEDLDEWWGHLQSSTIFERYKEVRAKGLRSTLGDSGRSI